MKQQRGFLNARVGVGFYEPCLKFSINHKIVPKNLKTTLPVSFVYLFSHTQSCHLYNFLHVTQDVLELSAHSRNISVQELKR